jgi:predicted metal-binding membrane protein
MTPLHLTRSRPEALAGLLAAAGLAWWWTADRMARMDAGPGADLSSLGWFTVSWTVMMAAMMLPSFAPTLAAYLTTARGRRRRQSACFVAGYLLVWTAAGVAAYGVLALGKSVLASDLAWQSAGRWLAGTAIAAAAVYELIPIKRECLARCRGQLGSARERSGVGWSTALVTGVRSGGWCIGSSAALMAALFALGAGSLTWMALIAALVAVEKLGPWPVGARFVTATVLVLLAAGILAAPHDVPGLVVPSSTDMHPIHAMGNATPHGLRSAR